MIVSIEQDAHYRRDGDRFVEICRSCARDRASNRCACGTEYKRLDRKLLALSWNPTTLRPTMPTICPHCEGPTDRLRSVTMALPTALRGLGYQETRWTIELSTCARTLPPFLAWLGVLTSAFFVTVFGLAALFGNGVPAFIALALVLAALAASWRAYGWLRFAKFNHRSLRFRVRRPGYARALAEANHGRVL